MGRRFFSSVKVKSQARGMETILHVRNSASGNKSRNIICIISQAQ